MIVWAIIFLVASVICGGMAITKYWDIFSSTPLDFFYKEICYIVAIALWLAILISLIVLVSLKANNIKKIRFSLISVSSVVLTIIYIFVGRKTVFPVGNGQTHYFYTWFDTLWLFAANIMICVSLLLFILYFRGIKTKEKRIDELEQEIKALKTKSE